MSGNRSLDEFVDDDRGDADDDGPAAATESGADSESLGTARPEDEADPARDDSVPAADDPPAVEPMAETYAWSADAGPCASCGGTVETRWRDGDELVCGDCKAW